MWLADKAARLNRKERRHAQYSGRGSASVGLNEIIVYTVIIFLNPARRGGTGDVDEEVQ
jgi:hypothetical protein